MAPPLQPREARHAARGGGHGGHSRRRHRFPSNFTYVSSWVKYTMFLFNFLFWITGALLVAVAVYAITDKFKSGEGFKFENMFDILFNLGFLLMIVGGFIFILSFAGCIGALRENMCLLQFYSLCLLILFLFEMGLAALGFIFPRKVSLFMEESLSEELIRSYRDDLDFQNLIDLVQQEFECCGISSEGFRDWSKNPYFNCTRDPKDNPSVERCGVPYSCCLKAASSLDDTGLVNIMCGFGVQEMKQVDVLTKIHTQGCIKRMQAVIEQNLYLIAGIALAIALAQLLVIWLARTLEGQIENQRSLWHY